MLASQIRQDTPPGALILHPTLSSATPTTPTSATNRHTFQSTSPSPSPNDSDDDIQIIGSSPSRALVKRKTPPTSDSESDDELREVGFTPPRRRTPRPGEARVAKVSGAKVWSSTLPPRVQESLLREFSYLA